MLLDKLEQESQDAKRRQVRFAVLLAVGTVLVGAFFFGLVVVEIDFSGQPASAERTPDAVETAAIPPPSSSATDTPDPAAEAARERFKTDLGTFQDEIEPDIAHADFGSWNAVAQREILDLKEAAVGRFGEGSYTDAVDTLAMASDQAARELAAREAAFAGAMEEARAAFVADAYDQASLRIARALEVRPGAGDALALQARIEQLPELLSLIEAAAVARVENNLQTEAKHLAAVLNIDPRRTELAARLANVRAELRERDYAAHIAAGLERVEARNPEAAKRSLQAAEGLFADRGEADVLAENIASLELELTFERLVREARVAAGSDDWGAVEGKLIEANRLFPDDRDILQSLSLAQSINSIGRRVGQYLAAPQRFAAERIAAEASELVSRANALAEHSPSLAARATELDRIVAAYGMKVPVRVLSDGETSISVRGVGVVGATTDRTIELRPGTYTFEGNRAGFRSKLVRIDIPPGSEGLVLEIFPDERI